MWSKWKGQSVLIFTGYFHFAHFVELYTIQIFWNWYIYFIHMVFCKFCILYVLHFAHFALCTFCKCLIFTRYFHFAQGGGGSHFWMHRINQHVGCSAPLPPKLFILLQLCCKWKTLLVRKHQIEKNQIYKIPIHRIFSLLKKSKKIQTRLNTMLY